LRDEFIMADEAFALSPISARAAQPREEDYDAISEAFMETSRGRWFLGEYARRNRNADTRMVLDAVSRIEETLAAQKQTGRQSELAEALGAVRHALDEARATASAALDSVALEETLAPVRKGARVIKEIAWRWREIGADGRICDLLDSQVSAIEAACGQLSSTDPRATLSAAFDLIKERIDQLGDGDTAPPQAVKAVTPSPSPTASNEAPAEALETAQVATIEGAPIVSPEPAKAVVAVTEAAPATAEIADATAEAADVATAQAADVTADVVDGVTADAVDMSADAADAAAEDAEAQDDAILELVALEMAAPDPTDADSDGDEIQVAELTPADAEIMAPRPEPSVAPATQPSLQPSVQRSLGSTLIASGIVRRPAASGPDPLAPIRRISQAEKIALFS
jgi:hypothetical protein